VNSRVVAGADNDDDDRPTADGASTVKASDDGTTTEHATAVKARKLPAHDFMVVRKSKE
jgi:hypothetical protein